MRQRLHRRVRISRHRLAKPQEPHRRKPAREFRPDHRGGNLRLDGEAQYDQHQHDRHQYPLQDSRHPRELAGAKQIQQHPLQRDHSKEIEIAGRHACRAVRHEAGAETRKECPASGGDLRKHQAGRQIERDHGRSRDHQQRQQFRGEDLPGAQRQRSQCLVIAQPRKQSLPLDGRQQSDRRHHQRNQPQFVGAHGQPVRPGNRQAGKVGVFLLQGPRNQGKPSAGTWRRRRSAPGRSGPKR